MYSAGLTVLARGKYESLACDYGSRLATRVTIKVSGPVTRIVRRKRVTWAGQISNLGTV